MATAGAAVAEDVAGFFSSNSISGQLVGDQSVSGFAFAVGTGAAGSFARAEEAGVATGALGFSWTGAVLAGRMALESTGISSL